MMNDEKERIQENAEEINEISDIISDETPDGDTADDPEKDGFTLKKSPDRKKKYFYMAISIVISFALWLNVVDIQNPDSERIIRNIPLTVLNEESLEEQDLVVTSVIIDTVAVTVSGKRSDVINIGASEIKASIDLENCGEGRNSIKVNIDSPRNINVRAVNPGEIDVDVEKVISEEKDVEILFEGVLTNDHEAVCKDISDEKVSVTGIRSMVDTVDKVRAMINISDLGIKKDKYTAELVPVDSMGKKVDNVTLSKESVDVSVMINIAKTVELSVDTVGRLPDNMELVDISWPEEIEITVPDEKAGYISRITAKPIDLSSIVGSTSVELELDLPDDVKLSKNQVKPQAVIKVDSLSSRNIEVETDNISISGLDPQLQVVFETDTVNVAVTAVSEKLKAVSAGNISLSINCSGMNEGSHSVKPAVEITGVSDKDAYESSVSELMIRLVRSETDKNDEASGTDETE